LKLDLRSNPTAGHLLLAIHVLNSRVPGVEVANLGGVSAMAEIPHSPGFDSPAADESPREPRNARVGLRLQVEIHLQAHPELGVMLKYRANRSAVSAVIPRRSRTISDIRVTGTRSAMASALADRPSGFITPRAAFRRDAAAASARLPAARIVVVNDFDLVGIAIPPHKAIRYWLLMRRLHWPSRSPFRRSAGGRRSEQSSTVETL